MRLLELDNTLIALVAAWTEDPATSAWLDFGADVHSLSPLALKSMGARPLHCLRVFTGEGAEADTPAGLVAFSHIGPESRQAMLWYLLGEKRLAGQGLTGRAVTRMLQYGFGPLGLASVWAWVADGNPGSAHILEKRGFRRIGVQRRCHHLDGRTVDRTLYDLLKEEFLNP